MSFLFRGFEEWRKRRVLRRMVAELPQLLAQRYGNSGSYSPAQVHRTLEAASYRGRYLEYVYALCLSAADAERELGDPMVSARLRKELADEFFEGDTDFTIKLRRRGDVGNSAHTSLPLIDQAAGAQNHRITDAGEC